MEEFSEDVTVKAELRCLRLEVQNMQLQMQCVHQEMKQLKEVVLAAIRPRNGEDASYQEITRGDVYQRTDLNERREKLNVVKIDKDHGRRCERRFGTDLEQQPSTRNAEDTIKHSREDKDFEALLSSVRDSLKNQALPMSGDNQNEELWEVEELANEERGARQLEAIMRSMGMIIPSDQTSDMVSDSRTDSDTDFDTKLESDVVTHDKVVRGVTTKNDIMEKNERHAIDVIGDTSQSEKAKSVCDSIKKEEWGGYQGPQPDSGFPIPMDKSIYNRLDLIRSRNSFAQRVQELQKGKELKCEEELETSRGGGRKRGDESEVEVRGMEGGEGDGGVEDVMRRLAMVSARRESEERKGVAERLAILAKRGLLA